MGGARGMALVAVAVAVLAGSAVAEAATRYAEPAGDGPPASCPQGNPCSLRDAILDASVADGDEVVVLPGEYAIAEPIAALKAIRVHGAPPPARPILQVTGQNYIGSNNPGAVLADLEIRGAPYVQATATSPGFIGSPPLQLNAGTAERLYVGAETNITCALGSLAASPALLRDSVCWNTLADGTGAALQTFAFSLGRDYAARLVNVTAYGAESGLDIRAVGGSTGTIDAVNVIARGDPTHRDRDSGDVVAQSEVLGSPPGNGATITLTGSNYARATAVGAGTSITPPGTGSNRTQTPILAGPVAGDFRQVTGSPTIDTGVAGPLVGSFDFEGQARVQGAAVDVGADEGSVPTPYEFSAKRRQRLRKLVARLHCLADACTIVVEGLITMKPPGGRRAVARAPDFVALRTKRVELTSGQRAKVKLEPLSRVGQFKRAVKHGQKVTIKGQAGTGVAGVTNKLRVRVLP